MSIPSDPFKVTFNAIHFVYFVSFPAGGYVFYLFETDQFAGTRAIFQTAYLKMEDMCLQMYYILKGEGTKISINAIHEEDRHSEEVGNVLL